MSETHKWLDRYEQNHRDLAYPLVYWAAVPLVVLGTVGLLWLLPVPQEFFDISPLLNWGSAFLMAATVYYFIISVSLAIGMLPFVVGVTAIQIWLANSEWSLRNVSLVLAMISLTGLVAGQIPNGSPRQVLRDIQLVMIGPVWILSNLYRRLGIPY